MTDENNKFFYYLKQIESKTSGYDSYAFRGQENKDWPLVSSATRRLRNYYRKEELDAIQHLQRCYIEYHKDVLLDPARINGFGVEEGRNLSDLEILAKLQHFGAATGLLDFTKNGVIALWFACQNEKHDGKIFIIKRTSTQNFVTITTYEETQKEITKILSPRKTKPIIWEPIILDELKSRILRQHSLFVIETYPPIPSEAYDFIEIKKEDKKEVLQEIKKKFDIDRSSLFRDFYGFTTINKADSDIPLFNSPTNYFELGNTAYQKKEHKEAIRYYSKAIDLKDNFIEAYYNRANSYAYNKDYGKAIKDYTTAIEITDRVNDSSQSVKRLDVTMLYQSYYNRANSYACLKKYKKAIQDYDLSIEKYLYLGQLLLLPENKKDNPVMYYNKGNSFYCLKKYQEAIKAYEKCIENTGNFTGVYFDHVGAWFNKGNSEVSCFQFDTAKESYTKALEINPNYKDAISNLESVLSIIKNLKVDIKEDKEYYFEGSKGNTGMFLGVNRLPDEYNLNAILDLFGAEEGFEGYDSFALIYSNRNWEIISSLKKT